MFFDLQGLVKYLLEGLAVAVAAFLIPQKRLPLQEVVVLGLTAAAIFAVLDLFSPGVGSGARQGAGWGIGWNMITEGFDQAPERPEPPSGVDDTPLDSDDDGEPPAASEDEGFCAF